MENEDFRADMFEHVAKMSRIADLSTNEGAVHIPPVRYYASLPCLAKDSTLLVKTLTSVENKPKTELEKPIPVKLRSLQKLHVSSQGQAPSMQDVQSSEKSSENIERPPSSATVSSKDPEERHKKRRMKREEMKKTGRNMRAAPFLRTPSVSSITSSRSTQAE